MKQEQNSTNVHFGPRKRNEMLTLLIIKMGKYQNRTSAHFGPRK